MKATELRIGNLVYDDNNEICRICDLNSDKKNDFEGYSKDEEIQIEYDDKESIYLSKVINPIPLTEEWLIKFGFTHPMLSCWFKIEHLEVYIQDNIVWYDVPSDCLEIKHVHQLQNLYFALTNEELKLK